MKILTHITELQLALNRERNQGKTLGFVPTMGALHQGHLSLLEYALKENDISICSIFVNPTQFNNPQDLEKYPRTPEVDLNLLKAAGCHYVFMPEASEIYSAEYQPVHLNLGILEEVMEAKFRPGHFQGVVQVVSRLFDIVQPHAAYFGQKDFQQSAVIKEMLRQLQLKIKLVICPIIREADGLAMSSRNQRLRPDQRAAAPWIYQQLQQAKAALEFQSIQEVKSAVEAEFQKQALMKLEYFEIVDADTLMPLQAADSVNHAVACIAVFMEDIRLIDNIILFS